MAPLPIWQYQHPRTLFPQNTRHFQAIIPGVFYTSVRNIEGMPPADFQNASSFRRLALAIFPAAARSHLPLREIENPGAESTLCHLEQRASAGLFYIIAMRR